MGSLFTDQFWKNLLTQLTTVYNNRICTENFFYEQLHSICHDVEQNFQTQTDFVPLLTNQRFVEIHYNEHYAEFSKIIDIILSGYGSLNVDNETLFAKFVFEQKYKNKVFFEIVSLTENSGVKNELKRMLCKL